MSFVNRIRNRRRRKHGEYSGNPPTEPGADLTVNTENEFELSGVTGSVTLIITGGDFAGTYNVDLGDGVDTLAYVTDPIVDPSPFVETDELTAIPAPVIYNIDDGEPVDLMEFYRKNSTSLLTTGLTHTVTATDISAGLELRQTSINSAGSLIITTDLTPAAGTNFNQQGVVFSSATLLSDANMATTQADADSWLISLSYKGSGVAAGPERVIDMDPLRIIRTATSEAGIKAKESGSSNERTNTLYSSGSTEQVTVLARVYWDSTDGLTITGACKVGASAWVDFTQTWAAEGTTGLDALNYKFAFGGRNSLSSSQEFDGTIYRCQIWAGSPDFDVTDSGNQALVCNSDGTLRAPNLLESAVGVEPDIDYDGTVTNAITGSHSGSQAAMSVARGSLSLEATSSFTTGTPPSVTPTTSAPTTTATAGGSITRRKLVSTSVSAGTGMHSTSDIPAAAGTSRTVAFWWRPTAASGNSTNTVLASETGQFQVYTDSSDNTLLKARAETGSGLTADLASTALDKWTHVLIHAGTDFNGTDDLEIYEDGVSIDTKTSITVSSELISAGVWFLLGDDPAAGTTTDDGCIGQLFDVCLFDGIIALADTNFDTGSWKDLSSTGEAALVFRIDGQNAADPGEDSSGNANHFTVESSGVTLSEMGLPPGVYTNRKLVSTSAAANTGMKSDGDIPAAAGTSRTIAFWWRATDTSTNASNVLVGTETGGMEIATDATNQEELTVTADGGGITTNATTTVTANTWAHVVAHLGVDHTGGKDIGFYIDGSQEQSRTAVSAMTELMSACQWYVFGDPNSGSTTADGCIGEIFDLVVCDGIIDVASLNRNSGTGNWQDIPSATESSVVFRLQGTDENDPGTDASGNGNTFSVESSGVTLSATTLPTGA